MSWRQVEFLEFHMKITRRVQLGIFWAVIAFSLLISPVAYAQTLKVVFSENYVPLSWRKETKMTGILIDILKESLNTRLDIKTTYTGYPWKRAQSLVERGLADAFVTVPTKSRKEFTVCSVEPAVTVDVSIYTHKDNPRMKELLRVKSYADLKDFVGIDYDGNDWAKNKFKHMKMVWARDLLGSYKMLLEKRGDVLVRNTFNYDYYSKNLNLGDSIVRLPTSLSSVAFHLCIRKSSNLINIIPAFDKVIKEMREDGKYEAIVRQYGSSNSLN